MGQAHRYVLSAFSPVLKNILLSNPHPHPLIFLSGVYHLELYLILEYIYLGETSVYNSKISRFTQVAKDLQIEYLEDTSVIENISKEKYDHESSDDMSNEDLDNDTPNEDTRVDISNQYNFINISNQDRYYDISKQNIDQNSENKAEYEIKTEPETKFVEGSISSNRKKKGSKRLYKCQECEATYQSKSALHKHISSKHEGIFYSCQYCGYAATQKSALKRHEESIHKGVKHSCNQCDYQATQSNHLRKHQKSVHEGMKYSCNQCNFLTGWKNNLRVHKDKKHPLLE